MEGILGSEALPLQAPKVCFFLFCLSFARSFSLLRGGVGFLSSRFAVVPDSFTTGSHGFNGVENPFRSCRSPTLTQKSHTGPYTGFSLFCSCSPYLSPTGKGWPVPETALPRLAGFVHNCPTRLQQGGEPASLVLLLPYLARKIAHRLSQGRVRSQRLFLRRLGAGSAPKSFSSL